MRLREYEYMLAIAEEKNMTRAAKRLFISQPALSKLLANVEAELGIRIFEQRDRRLVPTEAGKIYLEHARKIVEMNDQMEERIRQSGQKEELRLACPMIYSQFVTNCVIPAYLACKTGVSLRMDHISQRSLCNGLLENRWPLGIGMITPEIDRALSCIPIGQIEMVLAVPAKSAHQIPAEETDPAALPTVRTEALRDLPFLFPDEESFSGRIARDFFHEHRITPNIVYRSPMTFPLYQMVSAGAGVAILPSVPLVHMNLDEKVHYFCLDGHPAQSAVGLMFRKDRVLSQAEQQLVELVQSLY